MVQLMCLMNTELKLSLIGGYINWKIMPFPLKMFCSFESMISCDAEHFEK